MSFDTGLAQRIREYLQYYPNLEEKKMFGGLCFMISRHMCCGIIEDKLMARVGPEQYKSLLEREHTLKMDFTGKPMKGMLYVKPQGLNTDEKLKKWLDFCIEFINTLPPKK